MNNEKIKSLLTNNIDIWTAAQAIKTKGRGRKANNQSLHGIKKLRELILELAVRGKLVPQNPDDEPASELLAKIAKEKNQLVKEKKIKKLKKFQEIKIKEKPFKLPTGWEYTRLNDIGEWGAGATPSRSRHEFYGGDIPWFKSGELMGNYINSSEEHVTELALKGASLRYNKAGDVLIAMYGATIGKTSILSVPATTNQAVCACTPFSGLANIYLLTVLKAYKNRFIGMGAGGAQPNISREKIIATVIALPPLTEQHRIVAKVDELMALCDQLEQQQNDSNKAHETLVEVLLNTLTSATDHADLTASWLRISQHFDTLFTTEESIEKLKQTILQLAVMGKLVPQDPNDEPANKLLAKIAKEKKKLLKEGKIKKQKPLPEITDEEKSFFLHDNWTFCRLGSLCFSVADGPHFSPKYVSKEDGVPFLSTRNITLNGFDLSDIKYVSKEDHKNFCKRTNPKLNDIIYTKGGTTGIAIVNTLEIEFSVWVHLAVLKIDKNILFPRYIAMALNSPHCYMQSQQYTHGIGNKDLGLTRMILITTPLPPLAEQHRIVAKVDKLMAICAQLKAKLNESQTTQVQLADAIIGQTLQPQMREKKVNVKYSISLTKKQKVAER